MISSDFSPSFKFFRAVPGAPMPVAADPTALGTLPVAAYRYCAAVTQASRFGWYIFLPLGIQVTWDGEEMLWANVDSDEWYRLSAIQHPGFLEYWNSHAPTGLRDLSPPFIASSHHPGILQIWTGLFVQTSPGWSVLLKSPANLPASPGYQVYEGIIETDRWFGPMFINVRITKTDYPTFLDPARPLFQVVPIPRFAYSQNTLNGLSTVDSMDGFGSGEWDAFESIMQRKNQAGGSIGGYATQVRRRRGMDPE